MALQLTADPGPFVALLCLASASTIGEPAAWRERAALVRAGGTPVMVEPSARRWFAPGFLERDPSTANALLHSLSDADAESYARACEALAAFDLRGRLGRTPLLVAPGEHDGVVTVEHARATAAEAHAGFVVLHGVGHLPPAEDPAAVTALIAGQFEETS